MWGDVLTGEGPPDLPVEGPDRAMSEVAGDYGVGWWTVHRILVATAVQALGQAVPTTMIGIDETRARSVRWPFNETGWRRSDRG